jgi:F-type H+-transporting ATPase subunit epsilon
MNTMHLDIVTPERKVYSDQVDMVSVRGVEGELGIMANHAPLATPLAISIVTIKKGTEVVRIAISGGFLEVGSNKVIILAETAELPEDIDIERAREALHRAEQRLAHKSNSEFDIVRAQSAFNRALNRINLVEKK